MREDALLIVMIDLLPIGNPERRFTIGSTRTGAEAETAEYLDLREGIEACRN
jgi:hypothetical protein